MKKAKPIKRAKPAWDEAFQNDLVNIGLNIRAFRKARGLTQPELAERIQITATSMCLIEKGKQKPDLQRLAMIARELDKDLTDFFLPAAPKSHAASMNDSSGLTTAPPWLLTRVDRLGQPAIGIGDKNLRDILAAHLPEYLIQSRGEFFNAAPLIAHKITDYEGGECAIELVREAKHSILVTHFSTEIMSDRYIDIQKEKLEEGVEITRIIYKDPNVSSKFYEWESEFAGQNYRSISYNGKPISLDFVIIDSEKVLLALPAHNEAEDFRRAIMWKDPEIAASYMAMFLNLIPSPDSEEENNSVSDEEIHFGLWSDPT